METTFFILGLILYLLVLVVLLIRVVKIRQGGVYNIEPGLMAVVEPKINKLAYYVVILSKEIVRYSYILLLLLVERIIKLTKLLVIKIEKRFSKVVNQVKGKGEINKRGSVSLFLKEIKDHKEKIKTELSENY